MLAAGIAMAVFSGLIFMTNVFYWRVTVRLWRATRDSLIIEAFMRMVEFKPPPSDQTTDEREARTKWANSVNVAMGICISEELGDKLAEIVRTIVAVRTNKMDEKTKAYQEKLSDILSCKAQKSSAKQIKKG